MPVVDTSPVAEKSKDKMDVDEPAEPMRKEESNVATTELEVKDESATMQADDDDAVEY